MANIELVVKLPEQYYEIIQNSGKYMDEVARVCEDAVRNGTPLPKGHGRLKDEDEIKQKIENAKVTNEFSKNFAENIIRFTPTIIEADREVIGMTREEAIKWLKEHHSIDLNTQDDEAHRMAIKALEQQDKIIQILDDYDLEAWEILEKIKEVVE